MQTFERLLLPQMVLVGSAGRNSGKTTLACEVIAQFAQQAPVYALKVISVEQAGAPCHRGGKGCGLCTNFPGNFELVEETGRQPGKDTAQMLAAGAEKAFLLKTLKGSIPAAVEHFMAKVPHGALVVCESNTLALHVQPGVFLFAALGPQEEGAYKPSAKQVAHLADCVVHPRPGVAAGLLQLHRGEGGTLRAALLPQAGTAQSPAGA